jgi:hypothetical protein
MITQDEKLSEASRDAWDLRISASKSGPFEFKTFGR